MFEGAFKPTKASPENVKDVKLNTIQNGFLGFIIFFYFDTQKLKFLFSKINAHKIQILEL